jgi:hypothetical protein
LLIKLKPVIIKREIILENGEKIKIYRKDNTFTNIMNRIIREELEEYNKKYGGR